MLPSLHETLFHNCKLLNQFDKHILFKLGITCFTFCLYLLPIPSAAVSSPTFDPVDRFSIHLYLFKSTQE